MKIDLNSFITLCKTVTNLFNLPLKLKYQGRNKLLKSGGAHHLIAMRNCKIRGEFWSFPPLKQWVHVHPWDPQFQQP